jgi:hypothetical protein
MAVDLALLGQVLTDENLDGLLARAAYRTKAEVDSLAASVRPRPAPAEGIRKLPEPRGAASAVAALPSVGPMPVRPANTVPALSPCGPHPEMKAVSEDRWSLRVTIDRGLKEDLETLAMMLSHKVPRGDLAAVLREAIRSGIEKHGKRKGAIEPRRRSPHPEGRKTARDPRAIPVDVRRAVWKRDGGRCTWTGPDERRCDSRWQLELDHIEPPLIGGRSTVENLRLRCRLCRSRHKPHCAYPVDSTDPSR